MSSRLNTPWLTLVISVVLLTILWALLLWKEPSKRAAPIVLLCAEALREPIEEIVPLYERKFGQRVEVRFGESRKILTDLEVSRQGDVFLPADDSYIIDAQGEGLLREVVPLVQMNAVIVVNIHSGKQIQNWDDLFHGGVRFALPNVKAAAVSRLTAAHLGEARFRALRSISVEMGAVTQTANAINLGQGIDAGLIWDNMLAGPHLANLRKVPMKEMEDVTATVFIGAVTGGPRYAEAQRFAEFVGNCSGIFQKHGFTILEITP